MACVEHSFANVIIFMYYVSNYITAFLFSPKTSRVYSMLKIHRCIIK